jgi:hypothetical protein
MRTTQGAVVQPDISLEIEINSVDILNNRNSIVANITDINTNKQANEVNGSQIQVNINQITSNISEINSNAEFMNNTRNVVISNSSRIQENLTNIAINDERIQFSATKILENQTQTRANTAKIAAFGKYSQTGPNLTVTNTTVPTAITNSGSGNLLFPGNILQAGDNYRISVTGTIQTENKDQELEFLVESVGNGPLHSTTFIDLDEVKQDLPFQLHIDITFPRVGASGTVESTSILSYQKGLGSNDARSWQRNGFRGNFDTTREFTLGIGVRWNEADNENILVVRRLLVTKTF